MPHHHGSEIDTLIQLLGRLPGLGPRSARRAVLALLKKRESLMRPLSQALDDVADRLLFCDICGNVDTVSPCHICNDPKRDQNLICVVEDIGDLWALERSETFKGVYHVLGGTLSALDGIGPDDLKIADLVARAAGHSVREIIMALNATVEGQTTSYYISEQLIGFDITVSALAHGVPVGGELDYLDDGTLTAAMKARRHI